MPATAPPESPATSYVGRFAPSPSGPLHFGSLVCALASYLDARAHGGRWLVRMEDIDPPREEPGAQDSILQTLQAHGLEWDGAVLRQSSRHQAYRELLSHLRDAGLSYRCNCTRKRLQSLNGPYDGHCRRHPPAPEQAAAIRLKVAELPAGCNHPSSHISFTDAIQGSWKEDLRKSSGDFVIHRKDGLFAYQLAVVADDIAQGITHVVRGSDLLETTARQIFLFHILGQVSPGYAHIPVVVDEHQHKLSKQNRAPAVDDTRATANLWQACRALGLRPPVALRGTEPQILLGWAIEHWHLSLVPRRETVPLP